MARLSPSRWAWSSSAFLRFFLALRGVYKDADKGTLDATMGMQAGARGEEQPPSNR